MPEMLFANSGVAVAFVVIACQRSCMVRRRWLVALAQTDSIFGSGVERVSMLRGTTEHDRRHVQDAFPCLPQF
jgi:hypothetical protein